MAETIGEIQEKAAQAAREELFEQQQERMAAALENQTAMAEEMLGKFEELLKLAK